MADTSTTSFFQEDDGAQSSLRLMSFVSLFIAVVCGILVTIGRGSEDGVIITYAFLAAAFAPKAMRKFPVK